MIGGKVVNNEPAIRFIVVGPKVETEVLAIIDTGFTRHLAIPDSVIRKLDLKWKSKKKVILGDGSVVICEVYSAAVRWDGNVIPIEADDTGGDCLIGTELLRNFELKIQFRHNGKVTIKKLS